jgi:hypothetical protein
MAGLQKKHQRGATSILMLFCDGFNNYDILDAYEAIWQNSPMDPVTTAMLKEYCRVEQFSGLIMPLGVDAFLAVERVLQAMPPARFGGETTVASEPVDEEGVRAVEKEPEPSEATNFPRSQKAGLSR